MNLGPMAETVRNLYAPYGLMSAAQHYSLYLRHYVDTFGVPADAAAEVALTCRENAHDNERALMRGRSEEHTSELQSLMRISYAVFCLQNTTHTIQQHNLT